MNQELYLHESILLLSLDDEKGSFSTSLSYLNYGFAFALMMDLILLERIYIEDNNRVKIKTNAITENKLLNEILIKIQSTKKPKKLSSWLHSLVSGNRKFMSIAIDNLIKNKILEKKKEKIMWIFSATRYPTVNPQAENLLRARLRQIIFDDDTPQPKELMVLAIIQACQMENTLTSSKKEKKYAKQKIKILTDQSEMRKVLGDAIEEMQTIVTVITTTSI